MSKDGNKVSYVMAHTVLVQTCSASPPADPACSLSGLGWRQQPRMRTLKGQRREGGDEGAPDVDIEALAKAFEHDADDLVVRGRQVSACRAVSWRHDRLPLCCERNAWRWQPIAQLRSLLIGQQ